MISLCYHNGALGHCAMALLECCTVEGNGTMPEFHRGKNLHHYKFDEAIVKHCHPDCDVNNEQNNGNLVLSSTSNTAFGRYLIILMGLYKWNNCIPNYNQDVVYDQSGENFGEELETLSLTLKDKIKNNDWYADSDVCLEILDYWKNTKNIIQVIKQCNLTPIVSQVEMLCDSVVKSNSEYLSKIENCYTIANDVLENKIYTIDVDFLETAIVHGILLDSTGVSHTELKLLTQLPTSTEDFIRIL